MSASATIPAPTRLRRVGRAIGWSIVTTLKILFVMAVVGLIAVGAYAIGVTVDQQTRILSRRLALLEYHADQAALNHETQAAEIDALSGELSTARTDMDSLGAELAADIAAQETMLAQLETELAAAISSSQVISGNLSSLTTAAVALQSDISSNTSSIDALGGELDGLRGDLTAAESSLGALSGDLATLDESVAGLTDADAALLQFQQTLTLFRTWELLSRARLRLAENNLGLASADIAAAQALLATVAMPVPEGAESSPVDIVQGRLTLVASSLPADPLLAAADLDLAWDALDNLMGELLGLPAETPPAPEAEGTP
ncbi:MAG: hypothetical protein KDE28_23295 [Anaerolineales bacterium]|nr:hypothetical protein [Anaerolineales bacterium]